MSNKKNQIIQSQAWNVNVFNTSRWYSNTKGWELLPIDRPIKFRLYSLIPSSRRTGSNNIQLCAGVVWKDYFLSITQDSFFFCFGSSSSKHHANRNHRDDYYEMLRRQYTVHYFRQLGFVENIPPFPHTVYSSNSPSHKGGCVWTSNYRRSRPPSAENPRV